ncbi:MAG: TetR/AcrR family transcriptional regulator [Oceanicaulis sp.]
MTLEAFRKQRAEEKRANILKSAAAAFMSEGYSGARMEAVARAADVSTATLYGYFNSKEALLASVIEAEMGRFDLSGEIGLKATARAYARLIADPGVRGVIRLVIAETPRFPELGALLFEHGKAQVYAAFAAAFELEAGAGRLARREDWAVATGQITGMIGQPILMTWLLSGREPARDIDAIADAAAAVFLRE